MENINKPLKVYNISSYRLIKNNKCYDIINYGEVHGFDIKINFNIFKNDKACFYIESFFNDYQKNWLNEYFIKTNSKKFLKLCEKKNYDIRNRPTIGYNNIYHLQKYFAYYYKKNGYKFTYKKDKQIIEKCEPYNKLWNYYPCDCRGDYDKCFHSLNSLLYMILKFYIFKKMNYPNNFEYFINNKQYERIKLDIFKSIVNINLTSEILKRFYNGMKEKYNLYNFKNDEIFIKTSNIYKKYFNKDYDNFINDNSDKNLNQYFKNINLADMMIDLFNIQTYFKYENDLIKFKSIKEFIKNYFKDELYFAIYYKELISFYDIMLYINLNNNIEKTNYHIIYNGDFHRRIFEMYIYFLCKYEGFQRII